MSFKICSIGCGGMAVFGHGPALRKYALLHSDTVLAACCDVDSNKAQFFQQEFGFQKHYTDMYTMLNNERPDVVCLIVPVHLTARLAVAIMEMGFPLIFEKPPGVNKEETLEIVNASQKHKVKNRVAFNRRYMPLVDVFSQSLLPLISEERLQNISCNFFRINRRDPDFSITAIHGIDLVRHLAASDYEHIRFRYKELSRFGEGVANIFMDCTLKSGITAQLSFCPVAGMNTERYTANAESQMLQLHVSVAGSFDFPGKLVHIEENKILWEISGSDLDGSFELFESGGFYHENASFFDDLKAGKKPVGDVKTAIQCVEVAQCIRCRMDEYKS